MVCEIFVIERWLQETGVARLLGVDYQIGTVVKGAFINRPYFIAIATLTLQVSGQ